MPNALSSPLVLIITGLPGSGKTTLAERLADRFALPFVNKDRIKESLFDNLGWSDRAWSKKLGAASYQLLYTFAEAQLRAGRSFIVESNFDAVRDTPRFLALQTRYPFIPFQIHCITDDEARLARYRNRQRHLGHVDHLAYAGLEASSQDSGSQPLALGGQLITIDTTRPELIDYESLFQAINQSLPTR